MSTATLPDRTLQTAQAGENCSVQRSLLGPAGRVAALCAALVLLSVIVVSAAETAGGAEALFFRAVWRRLQWVLLSIPAFAAGCLIPYGIWRRYSGLLIGAAIILLVMVLFPTIGTSVSGARRWIRLGPSFGFQPSEFAKPALLIWLSAWCARCREHATPAMHDFKTGLLIPGIVIVLTAGLILKEPDFGTAALTAAAGFTLLLICGASAIQALLCLLASAPILHMLITTSPYRLQRVTTFLNPLQDVRGSGYQLVQSLAAIASGGILGRGPGEGGIAYLPAASNDFIFSVIARQFGFLGAMTVILIFAWLLWEGINIALKAPDTFGFALASGITILICMQAAIHIAVATGSAPTTGMTMPLVSAGGSSLLFTLWSVGILCNISLSSEDGS